MVVDFIAPGATVSAFTLPSSTHTGFTVFFTGLSGSGKSTIANELIARLEQMGRVVSLLDGDLVRKHLTSELGFSKEHRDLNVRRVGFVAFELTRCGAAVICALIAPYDETRRSVRRMIEDVGGFLLVHLATPLEVCEARDPKGLYARARAGVLTQFTGVSDPYEPPADADLVIDTSTTPVGEAVDRVLAALSARGCTVHVWRAAVEKR